MANDYTLKEKGIIRADATKIYPSVDAMYGPWASVAAFRTYLGEILGGTVTDDIIPNSVEIGIIQEDGTVKRYEWQKPTNGQGSWVESGGGAVASVNGKTGVVVLDKTDIGLGNVDNTSDLNKPISTATQTALNAKANASDLTAHTGSTSNPHGVTKAQVGLGNVDNTADADKIVKRATEDGSGNVITSTYETKTDAQSKITNLASDVADTYQTKTDAASAHSNIQGQVTTLSNTVANLTGLDGTNFGGFSIQQSDSLAVAGITTLFSQMGYTAGDTHWFLAGTSMASLKAYRFDGVQTDPVLISNDVYDFTDFSGLQTKVDKFKGTTNDIDSLNSGSDIGIYFYVSASKMGLVSVAYDATHSVVTQHWLSDMTPDATDPAVLNEGPAILMRTYKNSAWSAWQNPIGELAAQVAAFGPKIDEALYTTTPLTTTTKNNVYPNGGSGVFDANSAWETLYAPVSSGETIIYEGTNSSNGIVVGFSTAVPTSGGSFTYIKGGSASREASGEYTAESNGYIVVGHLKSGTLELSIGVKTIKYAEKTEIGELDSKIDTTKAELEANLDDALFNDVTDTNINVAQTSNNMQHPIYLQAGKTYILTLQMIGFTATQFQQLSNLATRNSNGVVGYLKSSFEGYSTGNPVSIEYTPSANCTAFHVQFNSAYKSSGTENVKLLAVRKEDKYVSSDAILPLHGKKVLMLGDSITQLPRTGTTTTGNGIVEYFAQITGAEVIRGAVGGSHLRTRRVVTSVEDITDVNYARACTDISKMVEQLIAGDFTLARAGLANQGDSYVLNYIIPVLEALDMTTVDILTIFGGTNDYANNVVLGDVGSTDTTVENGAWNYMLEALTTAYPNLSIFVFTPIVKNANGNWCEESTNTQGLYLHDYAKCNQDAAKRFHIPSCDLYYEMGINKFNVTTYLRSDGTHPLDYGFKAIAKKMAAFVVSHLNRM